MIERPEHLRALRSALNRQPVVALVGARQVGKTTLARQLAARWQSPVHRFDLEDPRALARLADAPLALSPLRGLVILDEIQHRPELFPYLRVLADRRPVPARFLVLGSASPALLRQSSESLAGRLHVHELAGLSLAEIGAARLDRLWLRGGFPRAFAARSERASREWREDFLRTLLERDLPALGFAIPPPHLRRFWTMVAHLHGQIWNAAELARSMGLSAPTVRSYLDLLTGAFLLRRLPPWLENLGKRQVKSPKVYVRDSGLLHALLDIPDRDALDLHPRLGASWEGFVLEQLIGRLGASEGSCYFWATHGGAELDLLVVDGRRRLGFEIKRTSSPSLTPSMRQALVDLRLDHLDVIHAGDDEFPLAPRVRALPAARLLDHFEPLASGPPRRHKAKAPIL